jgi:MFS transporter, ACS family, hexuronate transporter
VEKIAMQHSRTQKNIILASLFVAWIVAYADRVAMSISIVPMAKELSLDAEMAGYALGAFYLTYALMQLGGGWLSDRMGSRRVLVFCVASWSLFTTVTGTAWSFVSLVMARLLFGIGEGGFSPASSVTIAETFPKRERARAKSLVISSVAIGSALGTGVIAAAISVYGWRNAYFFLGAIGLVVALGLWLVVGDAGNSRSRPPAAKGQVVAILRQPMMLKITLIWFFSNIVSLGLQSWMPSYLVKTYNIDILHLGAISAAPYLIAFCGLNVTGWLLDKFGDGREGIFISVGTLLGLVFLALMTSTGSLLLLVAYWTLGMVAHGIVFAALFVIPLKRMREETVGTATGVMNFGGQIAGAVAPAVMGWLIAHLNQTFTPAFMFLIGSGVLSFVVALTLLDRHKPINQTELSTDHQGATYEPLS